MQSPPYIFFEKPINIQEAIINIYCSDNILFYDLLLEKINDLLIEIDENYNKIESSYIPFFLKKNGLNTNKFNYNHLVSLYKQILDITKIEHKRYIFTYKSIDNKIDLYLPDKNDIYNYCNNPQNKLETDSSYKNIIKKNKQILSIDKVNIIDQMINTFYIIYYNFEQQQQIMPYLLKSRLNDRLTFYKNILLLLIEIKSQNDKIIISV